MSLEPQPQGIVSAASIGLHGCRTCGLVSEVHGRMDEAWCPRCHAPLHRHTSLGLQRTWAYLIAAAALYIPANVMPVMTTATALDGSETHTIMGGIIELWQLGSWVLALIVFVASIMVPMLKMISLTILAATAQGGSAWARPGRTKMYRFVEVVGHWSMLDVLVVVLLVAMVNFGSLAYVEPERGLLAFGSVVVLTMLASASFDPRLIWNRRPEDE